MSSTTVQNPRLTLESIYKMLDQSLPSFCHSRAFSWFFTFLTFSTSSVWEVRCPEIWFTTPMISVGHLDSRPLPEPEVGANSKSLLYQLTQESPRWVHLFTHSGPLWHLIRDDPTWPSPWPPFNYSPSKGTSQLRREWRSQLSQEAPLCTCSLTQDWRHLPPMHWRAVTAFPLSGVDQACCWIGQH